MNEFKPLPIAEQLRQAAKLIAQGKYSYCCFALLEINNRPVWHEHQGLPAVRFLADLGMPLDGAGFEGRKYRSRQEENTHELRVTWLEFAADIADEWGVQ